MTVILQDERLSAAFAEATELHGGQASPSSTAALRSGSLSMQTPALRSQVSGTATASAADVEGVAKNLGKMGFDGVK